MSFRPISISLSPNVEPDDIRLVLKLIFRPWLWKKRNKNKESEIESLENEFKKYFNVKYAFSFNSARSCFFALLKSLDLNPESEVLLQSFTCNATVNPILWAGLKPKYVDCSENDFNIDLNDLKNKVSLKTRVLLVQHTFGMPADMESISEIAKENNLILIEDCAHSLGAEYNGKKVGSFGKAAFFSFSRDKIISSIYGGILITNDSELAQKINDFRNSIKYPPHYWILQQLIHPLLLNYIVLPIYNFIDLGKLFLILSQWLHIVSKAVHWKEKRGQIPSYFPKKLPNALAMLSLNQFKKLERFNNHRQELADFYYKNLSGTKFILPEKFDNRKNAFLRFSIKHPDAHSIIYKAWEKENILIGDWYTTPIAPYDTKLEEMEYIMGMCPKAEKLANITLNLPTHINISKKDAQRIIDFLKSTN